MSYAQALRQLESMGFSDRQANIEGELNLASNDCQAE